MISTTPVEIIGITETWVDTAGRVFEGEYRLPGYSSLPVEGSDEDMWSRLCNRFFTIQQRCIPRKRVGGPIRVQPNWFHWGNSREVKKRRRLVLFN